MWRLTVSGAARFSMEGLGERQANTGGLSPSPCSRDLGQVSTLLIHPSLSPLPTRKKGQWEAPIIFGHGGGRERGALGGVKPAIKRPPTRCQDERTRGPIR